MDHFDVVVIGAGPAGYISAIRAAQLGLKVACVEKWLSPSGKPVLGGTCLNVGCIPSKALLASSEKFEEAKHHLAEHGIQVQGATLDLAAMLARKNAIVSKMTQGIEFLFRKNKITWLKGHARLTGARDGGYGVAVEQAERVHAILAQHLVIATGSRPRQLPGFMVDNQRICDNEGALNLPEVPRRLGVIGAGVIGLELGSVWRRLGAEVTVLEAAPQFLSACDSAVAKECFKLFSQQGLNIQLGVTLGAPEVDGHGIRVPWTSSTGQAEQLEVDRLIVAVGRAPNTEGLDLSTIGLELNERGQIPVDQYCQTSVPRVYAIGDVVRGPMLAHKGEDEGVMVAERIAGQKPHIDYNTMPWVIYTAPEIAWVGQTEQQLAAQGVAYRVGQFPLMANGRALGMNAPDGFVKILADAHSDEVLGVHMVAPNASDLIAEAVVAMEFRASSEDLARICHAHPSLSEAVREAALAVDKRALNI